MENRYTLNLKGKLQILDSPKIMGILNITPDSFYDGGKYTREKDMLMHVEKMLLAGADIIDIGGYSSRPGAENIAISVEKERIEPAIQAIIKFFPKTIISIDTFRSEIARIAVEAGASMVNDISAGQLDPNMLKTVVQLNVPYIIMHMRGNPQTMQNHCHYNDLVEEIINFFVEKINLYLELGGKDVIIDPGFGFAKNLTQNYKLLKKLAIFKYLGYPLLVGFSRKSMIYKKLKITTKEALNGTTILNTFALLQGIHILRVHDVKEAKQIVTLLFNK